MKGCPIIPKTVVFCVAFRPEIAVIRRPKSKDTFSNERNFCISILLIIENLYTGFTIQRFDLTYSAANKGTASELIIFSDTQWCPNLIPNPQFENPRL